MRPQYIRIRLRVSSDEASYNVLASLPDDDSKRDYVKTAMNLLTAKVLQVGGAQPTVVQTALVEPTKKVTTRRASSKSPDPVAQIKKIPSLSGIGNRNEEGWGL